MPSILIIALVFQFIPYQPTQASASGGVLRVSGVVSLPPLAGGYTYSDIVIEEKGRLTLEAGTVVRMEDKGAIMVYGSFRAYGTNDLPVVIDSVHPGGTWKGMVSYEGSGQITLRAVDIRNFTDPLTLLGTSVVVDRLQLTDGVHNSLVLGNEQTVHTAPYEWKKLVFANRLRGADMRESGVLIKGSGAILRINSLRFSDTRPYHEPGVLYGIRAEGIHREVSVSASESDDGCRFAFRPYERMDLIVFELDRSTCEQAVLPIVFVPGYGTSINLKKLARADDREPDPNGWRFLNLFTPQYTTFLDTVRANGVPYEIAFYDWRLSADDNVQGYLIPAIDRALKKYKARAVTIVAHSFGGIVSRSYIQGDGYRGDVVKLVQIGTPNQGAAKAYPVWEGGILPQDWSVLQNLIRLYEYQRFPDYFTNRGIVQYYFPSVRDMLPIYPALKREQSDGYLDPTLLVDKNSTLLRLRSGLATLTGRVQVATIYSDSEPTLETLRLDAASAGMEWPDGRVLGDPKGVTSTGDGTVPRQSVLLDGAVPYEEHGTHMGIVASSAQSVLAYLYPNLRLVGSPIVEKEELPALWISVDCPVETTVILPDGTIRVSGSVDGPDEIGEVEESPEMSWILVPRSAGVYAIRFRALESTTARLWIDSGDIKTVSLAQNETVVFHYAIDSNGVGSYVPETGPQEVNDFTGKQTYRQYDSIHTPCLACLFADGWNVRLPLFAPRLAPLWAVSRRGG